MTMGRSSNRKARLWEFTGAQWHFTSQLQVQCLQYGPDTWACLGNLGLTNLLTIPQGCTEHQTLIVRQRDLPTPLRIRRFVVAGSMPLGLPWRPSTVSITGSGTYLGLATWHNSSTSLFAAKPLARFLSALFHTFHLSAGKCAGRHAARHDAWCFGVRAVHDRCCRRSFWHMCSRGSGMTGSESIALSLSGTVSAVPS
jgi:hypothetical protein